jgi:hypothetical protein
VATQEDWDEYNLELEEFEKWLSERPLDDEKDIRWSYPGVDRLELDQYKYKKELERQAEAARIRQEEYRREQLPIWQADPVRDLPQDVPPAVKLVLERGEIRSMEDGSWGPGGVQRVQAEVTVHIPFAQDQAAQVEDQAHQIQAKLEAPAPNPEELPEWAALQDLRDRSEAERDQLANLEEELAAARAQYQNLGLTGMGITRLSKKIQGLEAKVEVLKKRAPLFETEIKRAEAVYKAAREVLLASHRERVREEAMAPVRAAKEEALRSVQTGLQNLLTEFGPALLLADQLGI